MEGFSKALELSSFERSCVLCAFRADSERGSLEGVTGRESRRLPLYRSPYKVGQMQDSDLFLSVAVLTE